MYIVAIAWLYVVVLMSLAEGLAAGGSWLGACIGPNRFEVGADVLDAFGASADKPVLFRFKPGAGRSKWFANLALLARDRLAAARVGAISGGGWCTVDDASRFFSYRRDGVTGRMVAAVWRHD